MLVVGWTHSMYVWNKYSSVFCWQHLIKVVPYSFESLARYVVQDAFDTKVMRLHDSVAQRPSLKLFSRATILPPSHVHTADHPSNPRAIPLLLGLFLRAALCTVSVRFFAWYLRFRGVLQELSDGIRMTGSPQRPNLRDYTSSSSHRDPVCSSFCIAESGLLNIDESPGGRVSDASCVRAFSSY